MNISKDGGWPLFFFIWKYRRKLFIFGEEKFMLLLILELFIFLDFSFLISYYKDISQWVRIDFNICFYQIILLFQ